MSAKVELAEMREDESGTIWVAGAHAVRRSGSTGKTGSQRRGHSAGADKANSQLLEVDCHEDCSNVARSAKCLTSHRKRENLRRPRAIARAGL